MGEFAERRAAHHLKMSAEMASKRPSTNHEAFMTAYAEWTERIGNSVCLEGDPLPPNPLVAAAQIEAYAAARRRAALDHPHTHQCDACELRRRYVPDGPGRYRKLAA